MASKIKLVTAWVEIYNHVDVDDSLSDEEVLEYAKKHGDWRRTINLPAKDFKIELG